MRYLLVWADYMSTGLRDEFSGLITPQELGLDDSLTGRLTKWVAEYAKITPLNEKERARWQSEIEALDKEGVDISRAIQRALGTSVKVSYFSEGLFHRIPV